MELNKIISPINKIFGDIAGVIRFGILILIIILAFKFVGKIGKVFDNSIPQYTTQHIHKPQYRPPPDITIRGIEHITQVKVKPTIVYDTIVYSSPAYGHMIRTLKANGKHIIVQTQFCNDTTGKEFIYPYTPMFQVSALPDGLDMTKYKNFFDWTGINVSFCLKWGLEAPGEVLFKSGIDCVPLRLKTQAYVSINGNQQGQIGLLIEKRFW